MPTGTIKTVYQIDRANKRPGAVVFSDGQKFSTFDMAPIASATGSEGQLAEYTVEQNGKYTNLKTLRVIGGAPVPAAAPRGEIIDLGTERMTRAIVDLCAAARELTAAVVKATALAALPAGAPVPAVVTAPAPPPATDELDAMEALLAGKEGADVAAAMFTAVRRKKDPVAAAKAMLAAHGLETP